MVRYELKFWTDSALSAPDQLSSTKSFADGLLFSTRSQSSPRFSSSVISSRCSIVQIFKQISNTCLSISYFCVVFLYMPGTNLHIDWSCARQDRLILSAEFFSHSLYCFFLSCRARTLNLQSSKTSCTFSLPLISKYSVSLRSRNSPDCLIRFTSTSCLIFLLIAPESPVSSLTPWVDL